MSQPARDWQRWNVQLDAQPSNRRLVLASRTPRTMRDAGWDPLPAGSAFTNWVDDCLSRAGFVGAVFVIVAMWVR